MELGADAPRNFVGDDEIFDQPSGTLNPVIVEFDPPLSSDDVPPPLESEEEYRKALEAFQIQLQNDPLWYFLTVYAGGRRDPSIDRLMQKSRRIPFHLLDILNRISPSILKREEEKEKEEEVGGLQFRLDFTDNEEVMKLVNQQIRKTMGKSTAKDDYEEWTEKRWDILVPEVFASAEGAVDELIGEYKDMVPVDIEPNFFISHAEREVRRAFAQLAAKISLRIDVKTPTRATYDKNWGRLNSEIYAAVRNRAFKTLFV